MDQQLIKRYLLGDIDLEERRQIEERVLTDDDFFEELLIAEDELTDQYINGALSPDQQEKFNLHFLEMPERRQKLRFARALKKCIAVAENSEPLPSTAHAQSPASRQRILPAYLRVRSPVIGLSLAAALLLIVVGLSWVVLKNRQRQNQPESNGTIFYATLTPGATRDRGELARIAVQANTSLVQLRLKTGTDDYRSYRVALRTAEGLEILTADKLAAETVENERAVILTVPAGKLTAEDYQLRLSGETADGDMQDIATYYFRVVKK